MSYTIILRIQIYLLDIVTNLGINHDLAQQSCKEPTGIMPTIRFMFDHVPEVGVLLLQAAVLLRSRNGELVDAF